tara:strand:+ start:33 stop:308 length:276 start_codon:yes stop_codon:yes gene_type:complete
MRKISEYQKEKKRKKDRETLQRKRDAINGPTKTARLKAEKEERAKMKAEKELQQMKSERRQQPEIMWKRLIEESGKDFEDVIFKKTVEYNF